MRCRCNLDKVEVGLLGQAQRVLDADDADLFTVGTNQPHLWDADPVVDTGLDADEHSLISRMGLTPGMGKGPKPGAGGGPWSRATAVNAPRQRNRRSLTEPGDL